MLRREKEQQGSDYTSSPTPSWAIRRIYTIDNITKGISTFCLFSTGYFIKKNNACGSLGELET